jgi:predicted deacylase
MAQQYLSDRPWFNVAEVAPAFGAAKTTVYAAIHRDEIPGVESIWHVLYCSQQGQQQGQIGTREMILKPKRVVFPARA